MIVATLLDAGVPFDYIERELAKLEIDGFQVQSKKVAPYHLAATRFQVGVKDHHDDHDHHGRHLGDIERIIDSSDLSSRVKENGKSVFRRLGQAEAKVHATDIEKIHFHEVGAVDSIVDIMAACIALDWLGVDEIFVAPLPLSHGVVTCAHGEWPIPGPATTELLQGFRWRNTDIEGELVTPTAAAVFSTLGKDAKNLRESTFNRIGYGAGHNDYGIPNVLRVSIGETTSHGHATEVTVIETTLDDMNHQLLDYTMTRLFNAGALDVWFEPIQMKKNRPAVKLCVLASSDKLDDLAHIVLAETTTLGIRYYTAQRTCLERSFCKVETSAGPITIKVATLPGGSVKGAPEYEDVKAAAERTGAPAKDIWAAAMNAWQTANVDQHTRENCNS